MSYIEKYTDKGVDSPLFVFLTDATDQGQLMTFLELCALKEQIDALYTEEQSRILQAELLGEYTCDGCTI